MKKPKRNKPKPKPKPCQNAAKSFGWNGKSARIRIKGGTQPTTESRWVPLW